MNSGTISDTDGYSPVVSGEFIIPNHSEYYGRLLPYWDEGAELYNISTVELEFERIACDYCGVAVQDEGRVTCKQCGAPLRKQ